MKDGDQSSIAVRVGEKTYSGQFQTEAQYHVAWQGVLSRAYRKVSVTCLCGPGTPQEPLELAIRRLGENYFLARFPRSGHRHRFDCRFYAANPDCTGRGGYTETAIKDLPEGGVSLNLAVPLRIISREEKGPDAPAVVTPTSAGTRGHSRSTLSLLALLHYLWEEADLTTWRPNWLGKRNAFTLNRRLRASAQEKFCGETTPLLDCLLIGAASGDTEGEKHNNECISRTLSRKTRLLVVAQLAAFKPEQQDNPDTLSIANFKGIPRMFLGRGVWERACDRFPRAVSSWRSGGFVTVIAYIEPVDNKSYWRATDLALMQVTKQFIPVDSSYEAQVADKLVEEGRAFEKPLRYDADKDVVFPDFILKDQSLDVPLEVFGRADEAYAARKAAKTRHYQTAYGPGGWWYWNAAAGGAMPAFPRPTVGSR